MKRVCLGPGCGNEITGRRDKVFCSESCRKKEANLRNKEAVRARRLARMEAAGCLDVVCAQCGRAFRRAYTRGKQTLCSDQCRNDRRQAWLKDQKVRRGLAANRIAWMAEARPIGALPKLCANCAHWTTKGCALESFRSCNPGVMSRHWQRREMRA